MKLVKKLLPIATIGSVAAIVTPLFTSCSQHQPFIIDGENFYIPTVSQAIPDYKTHPTGYDIPDAEKLYYQNIKNNPEVLFQDIQASTSYLMYNTKHQGDEEVKFIKQFNSCNIQQKFSGLEVDITKKQLSYRFDTKLEIYGAKFDSLEYVFDFVLSLNINIKKLEFRLVYDDTTIPGRWVFGPAAELLSN
ncbi:MAG: hypothetical protein MJ233_01250 [Mycoplasmoidaceae bacterium]|nr:hypothetical protein [Mycoplasmoidaceae bacterium]